MLGAIRTLWVVPHIGERAAELIELSFMIGISFVAARFVVRRFAFPVETRVRLRVGAVALALMLAAEFSLVRWMRGMSIREYFATRDPISAAAYYATLVIFALFPLFAERDGQPESQSCQTLKKM